MHRVWCVMCNGGVVGAVGTRGHVHHRARDGSDVCVGSGVIGATDTVGMVGTAGTVCKAGTVGTASATAPLV